MNDCPHFFPGLTGPNINILLYTDDLEVTDKAVGLWGLGLMLRHIEAHAPAFANLCIKLISRNSSATSHADKRIDDLIKNCDLDQIWFFGIHQGNREHFSMDVLRGGPNSELKDEEVNTLKEWMRTGGVLVTGDHSEQRPPDAIPPAHGTGVDEYWGLGRALGHRVPRAGKMRRWDGPPPRTGAYSLNTAVLASGSDFEDDLLQFDPIPQRLILQLFDTNGVPAQKGKPHPLFFYRNEAFIHVYPDHMHEGRVVLPDANALADSDTWPNSQTIIPEIVARGTDNSKRQFVDLVAVYNGDRANCGRIVADSTWHHYFNENLHNLTPPGEVNSVAHQIGQYYGNLTVWLTPLRKRRQMAQAMIRWLAVHPAFLEERVFGDLDHETSSKLFTHLGAKAQQVLSAVASPCEVHELLNALIPEEIRIRNETLYFPENRSSITLYEIKDFLLPTKQLLLGSLINEYHQEVAAREASRGVVSESLHEALNDVTVNGFKRALTVHKRFISQLPAALPNWFY